MVAHRQTVTVGSAGGDYTMVATGLKDGDKVIWAGFESLIEGTPVQEAEWSQGGPKALTPSPPTSPAKAAPGAMPGMDMAPKGGGQ